ncbi:MAG: hypothetical protein J5819_00310 [Eubacterium sp.]|nr:hypothetical protein [Eubacterium sp.]
MENEQIPFPNELKPAEEIAVELSDILYRMVDLLKKLISELAQYRAVDKEEKEAAELLEKMGGGK